MNSSKTLSAALALALCACSTALAQDSPDAKAQATAAGDKITAALSDTYDSRFEGKRLLGVYMGRKRLGEVVIEVGKSPEPGAVYRETVTIRMSVAGEAHEEVEVHDLTGKLSLVKAVSTTTNTEEGKTSVKVTTTTKTADGYQRVHVEDGGAPKTQKAVFSGLNRSASLVIMSQAIGPKAGDYAFQGVRWGDDPDKPGVSQRLELRIGELKDVRHRGRSVKASTVLAAKGDRKKDMTLLIDAEGRLLRMVPKGTPIAIVQGNADEVKGDLPEPKADARGRAKTPKEAVEIYFKVMAGTLKLEAFGKVMDWDHLHAEAAKDNPKVGRIDAEGFGKIVTETVGKSIPALTPEQLALLLPSLKVTESGDTAKVVFEGQVGEFLLKKHADGSWRIRSFPGK